MKKTILLLAVLLLSISTFCQINSYKMTYYAYYTNNPDGTLADLKVEQRDIHTVIITDFNKNILRIHIEGDPIIFMFTRSYPPTSHVDSDGDNYKIYKYDCIDDDGVDCNILICSWDEYDLRQFWIQYKNITFFYQGEFTHRIEKKETIVNNTSYET